MKAALAAPEPGAPAATEEPEPARPAAGFGSEPDPAAEEREAESAAERRAAKQQALEEQLRSEPTDAETSRRASEQILDTLRELEVEGVEDVRADCVSSLCRLAFDFGEARAAELPLESVTLAIPWDGEFSATVHPYAASLTVWATPPSDP